MHRKSSSNRRGKTLPSCNELIVVVKQMVMIRENFSCLTNYLLGKNEIKALNRKKESLNGKRRKRAFQLEPL